MIIAVASEENKDLKSRPAHHFGRCPFYVFVKVENDKIIEAEGKKNPFYSGHEVGEVPQFIANQKADVMISGGMGPRAIDWFRQLGVVPVTANGNSVEELVNLYLLEKISNAESCAESDHKHGHSHHH